jgi:hypothetical protein
MLAGVHRPHAPGGPTVGVGQVPPDGHGQLTRRAVLGGSALVGAALLVGCTSDPGPDASTANPTGESDLADADAQVRASVAADEVAIIALYEAVLVAYPGLSADLAPLRDEHVAHADAMGDSVPPGGAAPAAPGSQPQALAALIDAEQQAVAQRTAACEGTTTEDIARTIALIAASEAGHAEFLRGLT